MAGILVDSNIFIFAEIAEFPEHELAVAKLQQLKEETFVIDTIIISEVHYKLGKLLGWDEAEKRSNNIIGSGFSIYEPIFAETLIKAFKLSKMHSMKTNDAVIAQHCLDLGAKILTDNVKDFKSVPGLDVIDLR